MHLANRVVDSIVKNVYVRLLFWFFTGVFSAISLFSIIRWLRRSG